ncbi:ankyrin repeat domain-containing protein [Acetobacter sp. AN02]|uniref:ankyrin repeat domain-containing protein n=1 Tax=Acetobacter sp. AN02 TaxID=2894186 RepID=UPI00243465D9|nr:ankyrin repeat domain-containing protein [Acetobacter sp. AN02]MDG6093627.1 ankyrin repeat domain-containing protein [Acetobacter sp. AN02]
MNTSSTASASRQDNTPSFSPEQIRDLFLDAARDGDTDLVTGFISAGIDLNIPGPGKGHTALILSSYNGHADAARALLAAGADPDRRDVKGATALAGVSFKGQTEIARMLLEAGADVNATDLLGRTPLMFAAMFGRTDMVRLLLDARADISLKDGEGHTAADIASRHGRSDAAALLAS